MSHTPTPWHIAGDGPEWGIYSGTQTEKGGWVNSEQVLPFFDCDLKQGMHGKRHVKDGDFIVLACNAHDQLLEACEDCADFMGSVAGTERVSDSFKAALHAARAAIALAKGEPQ